jgi:molybdopterin-binding protein
MREAALKLSARNVIPGRLSGLRRGATTSHVKVDVGHGIVVTASITNEAVAALKLRKGDRVAAIIKASDVIIGK